MRYLSTWAYIALPFSSTWRPSINLFAEYRKPVDGDVAVDIPSSTPAKRIPLEIFGVDVSSQTSDRFSLLMMAQCRFQ